MLNNKQIELQYPYAERSVNFIGVFHIPQWNIKTYGISLRNKHVGAHVIECVIDSIPQWLAAIPFPDTDVYHTALLIIHEAREGVFAVVGVWLAENMLHLTSYFSPYGNELLFTTVTTHGTVTCVWELSVIEYERNAWVTNILRQFPTPNIDSYLKQHR